MEWGLLSKEVFVSGLTLIVRGIVYEVLTYRTTHKRHQAQIEFNSSVAKSLDLIAQSMQPERSVQELKKPQEGIMDIQFIGSPNYTKDRFGKKVDKVIIHWFGFDGSIEDVGRSFQKSRWWERRVSTHYAIAQDGRVHQYVQEQHASWGSSGIEIFRGVSVANLTSVQIEHEASPNKAFTDTQYETSARLCAEICVRHGLVPSESTIFPHRKFRATACPGSCDLPRLISRAREIYIELTQASAPPSPPPAPKHVFNQNLMRGDKGDEVGRLQDRLIELNVVGDVGKMRAGRGTFGPLTESAVREFQVRFGVIPSPATPGAGRFGPKTREKINAL